MRRCHWAAVTASLGQPAPQWTQVVTRDTDVGGSGAADAHGSGGGGGGGKPPLQMPTQVTTMVHKVAPPTSAAVVVS